MNMTVENNVLTTEYEMPHNWLGDKYLFLFNNQYSQNIKHQRLIST